jgi:uncharacterized protein (TIGR02996 family)
MTQTDFLFLVEQQATSTEQRLIQNLHANPDDLAMRGAYADWLYEHGRDLSAEAVRKGYVPGKPSAGYLSLNSGALRSGGGPLPDLSSVISSHSPYGLEGFQSGEASPSSLGLHLRSGLEPLYYPLSSGDH